MIDKILLTDFNYLKSSPVPFEKFKHKSFLVTGASGLIGSLFIKSLIYINQIYALDLKIIAIIRNYKKTNQIFANFDTSILEYHIADLEKDKLEVSEDINYIIHAASITNSKLMIETPVDVIRTNIYGSEKILELAKKKNARVIYLSSMEVYGSLEMESVSEDKLGYLDLQNVRTCYPESKRLCEMLFRAYQAQYGVDVIIARLAQTFGAGILESENRVFAQFAHSVIEHKNIVLHTEGLSEGNYIYTMDAIISLFFLLLNGKTGQAYNIVNEQCHTTIKAMAELVAEKVAKGKIKVEYQIDKNNSYGYAPNIKLKMSNKKFREISNGWLPGIDLKEAYIRMIRSISN